MTIPMPIRLLLVDDHSLFRRGLKALLSQDVRLEVCAEAGDVGEALRSALVQRPDVILLDNNLPGVRGVDAVSAFKESVPEARVLMLTVSEDANDLTAALEAGADGYLLKTMESDQLPDAIVRVLEGESVISPEMLAKLVSVFRSRRGTSSAENSEPNAAVAFEGRAISPAVGTPSEVASALAQLSPRERDILRLIARGDSNKLIGRELGIAETTVKVHVQHILRKLNLGSRVQAAVFATQHGLE